MIPRMAGDAKILSKSEQAVSIKSQDSLATKLDDSCDHKEIRLKGYGKGNMGGILYYTE